MSPLVLVGIVWIVAWGLNVLMVRSRYRESRVVRIAVPVLFGVTILVLWQGLVRQFEVSPVILPAPTDIAARFVAGYPL